MILVDLFNEINFDDIWDYIKTKHPIFLSDSFTELSENEKKIVYKNSYYTMKNTFVKIQNYKCFLDDNIIMVVVEEKDPDILGNTRFVSYLVEKKDIVEKKHNLSIWDNNENRIKHYGYNFIPWEEILGYSLCPKSMELDYEKVVSEIFCEMTRFGFDEDRIKKMGKSISKELVGTDIQEEVENLRKKKVNYDNWFNCFCDKIGISKAPKELYFKASEAKIIMKKNHLIHIEYLKSIIENPD